MSWIQTYTGVAFDVLAPKSEQVRVEDIAHALANLCRFTGHCNAFYSVAQHSVLVSQKVPAAYALQALLHDAPEAYCSDVTRPLKHSDAMAGYRLAEQRIWRAVAEAFHLPWEMHASVKHADTRMLVTEQRDLLGPAPRPWQVSCEPYPERIEPVGPRRAKEMFLARFSELLSPGLVR